MLLLLRYTVQYSSTVLYSTVLWILWISTEGRILNIHVSVVETLSARLKCKSAAHFLSPKREASIFFILARDLRANQQFFSLLD
jgi:hypothetical protein